MSTRIDNDVTLTHADAEAVAKMLSDLAVHYGECARKTRVLAVRSECLRWSEEARAQAANITKALWTWTA